VFLAPVGSIEPLKAGLVLSLLLSGDLGTEEVKANRHGPSDGVYNKAGTW